MVGEKNVFRIRHRANPHFVKEMRKQYEKGWNAPNNLYDSREFLESEEGVNLINEKLRKIQNRREGIIELGDMMMWEKTSKGIVGKMI